METQELINALTIVKPGLSNKEIIEQSTDFVFQNGMVVTYNDEISVRHPIDLEIEGAVKADEFYKFLNKTKAKKVLFKQEGNKILMKAGRSKVTLNVKEVALDLSEIQTKKKWEDFNADLFSAAEFVSFAASKDASTPALTCVHFRPGLVEATDKYRVAVFECDVDKEFLLPADLLPILKKINPAQICMQNEWVHFRNESGTELSSRVLSAQYPDLNKIWIEGAQELQLPDKLLDIVERAAVFASDDFEYDRMLDLKIVGNLVTVNSKSESSEFEETTKIEYDGPELKFRIVVTVLYDILKKEASTVLIKGHKIQFEGDGWKYLGLLKVQ